MAKTTWPTRMKHEKRLSEKYSPALSTSTPPSIGSSMFGIE